MYYYIFEPPQGPKEFERTAQIKELLSTLGIAGEMTAPLPGKTVEDLVELAIHKRYSTIIAVGSMELINRAAQALQPHEVVFGIIPTIEHPDISRLIGVSDWKSAAEQLKRRRFQLVRQGSINHQIYFLTPAHLTIPSDSHFELDTDDFHLQGRGGQITISPAHQAEGQPDSSLWVEIEGSTSKSQGFLHFFSRKPTAPANSHFQLEALQLTTQKEVAVMVAGSLLCHTPIICQSLEKPLKLIVSKGHTPLTLDVSSRKLV